MTAARRNNVHRQAFVEQQRFVSAAKIVQTKARKPSVVALRVNSLVAWSGLRSAVNEKSSLAAGGFGNLKASSGSLTSDKSAGTPALMRRCLSRSATSSAIRSSSMVIVMFAAFSFLAA